MWLAKEQCGRLWLDEKETVLTRTRVNVQEDSLPDLNFTGLHLNMSGTLCFFFLSLLGFSLLCFCINTVEEKFWCVDYLCSFLHITSMFKIHKMTTNCVISEGPEVPLTIMSLNENKWLLMLLPINHLLPNKLATLKPINNCYA